MRKKVVQLRCLRAQKEFSFIFLSKIKKILNPFLSLQEILANSSNNKIKTKNQTLTGNSQLSLQIKKPAFSLVEMLMALLVASILLAALAPVITKRTNDSEIKVINQATDYDKDMVVSVFTKDTDFNIPLDANQVRITMMGGGGKGGNAYYENRTFTTSQSFKVPQNVTKLRVFMVGAGGGGASGGMGNDTAYGNVLGAPNNTIITKTGITNWTNPLAKGNVPELDDKCTKSGITKWTLDKGSRQAAPYDSVFTVEICGGGGGGGGGGNATGGGGGSSGGYIKSRIVVPSNIKTIPVTVGGGGGGGGGENQLGHDAIGWGGGGGGSEMRGSFSFNKGVLPGGNGGSVYFDCKNEGISPILQNATDGSGTAGGGQPSGGGFQICGSTSIAKGGCGSLEGGGGGGGASTVGGGGGGGGATFFGRYKYSTTTDKDFYLVAPGGGGGASRLGGGGGGGGNGGGNGGFIENGGGRAATGGNSGSTGDESSFGIGGASPIDDKDYCTGGNGGAIRTTGSSGKNGHALIAWGSHSNVLSCQYNLPSNGGGGGGAGQIWMGEINVTPGQTINFNIGQGGAVQTSGAENGNDGGSTSIVVGSNTYSVSGGKGGKFENDSTYIANSGGLGGGIKTSNFNSSAIYKDWLKLGEKTGTLTGGNNGGQGYLKTSTQDGGGGAGGSVIKMDGTTAIGGNGGESGGNGINASSNNHGTGGGGGAGGVGGNFGTGGKGANGFIYIEWGGSNGGGGTVGEFTQMTVGNFSGDSSKRTMKIRIGRGGGITGQVSDDDPDLFETATLGQNGNGGTTTISVISNNKTVTGQARGGLKGNDGTMDKGIHGENKKFPSTYSNLYTKYVKENINIITGQEGSNDYGGMGGYLACLLSSKDKDGNITCATSAKANDTTNNSVGPIRPGCGGSSILSPLYEEICNITNTGASPKGNNGVFGGGGGGGAVLNNVGGTGGNGGNGFVILEYKSTMLD